jgi:cold shock CspA family protein
MCYVFADAVAAESYSAYIYGKPAAVKMTNAAVGHFQETQATPFVQRAAAPVEQQVAKRIEGRVTKINKDQGFGYLATEQGALFFHQAQLVGCHYTELNAGDVMLFDVVFNFVSGKHIAKNVSFVEAADRSIGHCQRMETAKLTTTSAMATVNVTQLNVTGTIVEVNADHGLIDCEHELVFFYYNQLCGTIMSELKPGMTVGFNKMFNNTSNKLVAHSVKIVDQPQPVGHFIDMTTGVVHTEASAPNLSECSDKQLMFQTCERPAKRVHTTIGHCQRMEATKLTATSATPSVNIAQLSVTGTITEVNTDHGFIDCEQELVFFHYSQLCGTIMSELKPGMTVGFNKMFNNTSKKLVAHSVKIVDQPLPVGHFIDMTTGVATTEASSPNATELSDKQLAFQACDRPARTSSGLQAAKNLLQIEAAAFVRRLSTHGNVIVNELLEVPKEETVAAPRSRKGSIMSDLFLTPSGRTSRRGSICSARR